MPRRASTPAPVRSFSISVCQLRDASVVTTIHFACGTLFILSLSSSLCDILLVIVVVSLTAKEFHSPSSTRLSEGRWRLFFVFSSSLWWQFFAKKKKHLRIPCLLYTIVSIDWKASDDCVLLDPLRQKRESTANEKTTQWYRLTFSLGFRSNFAYNAHHRAQHNSLRAKTPWYFAQLCLVSSFFVSLHIREGERTGGIVSPTRHSRSNSFVFDGWHSVTTPPPPSPFSLMSIVFNILSTGSAYYCATSNTVPSVTLITRQLCPYRVHKVGYIALIIWVCVNHVRSRRDSLLCTNSPEWTLVIISAIQTWFTRLIIARNKGNSNQRVHAAYHLEWRRCFFSVWMSNTKTKVSVQPRHWVWTNKSEFEKEPSYTVASLGAAAAAAKTQKLNRVERQDEFRFR